MTTPDYLAYHKSLTNELHALKDRIRTLAPHWPTDGEFKEAALRTILRRHLPESFIVGRGFIVTAESSSTQIDLLIVDGNKPTLFRDGDLMLVTPDCVRAVIEVKTCLTSSAELEECTVKLANVGKLCCGSADSIPWLGVFSYEGTLHDNNLLLNAVEKAHQETNITINSIAYGKDRFVRFWPVGELEQGDNQGTATHAKWRIYGLRNLASSYFVGNVIDFLSGLDRPSNSYAWFPLTDGKKIHMRGERILGDTE